MKLIKRYPNRKLYDTEAKNYVTLEDIAALIRNGEEVQILDHASGEDLTALTLTQIIMDQEKRKGKFLPRAVLTALIQAGGDSITNLREKFSSPQDLIEQVDEEIENHIQGLIQSGEMAEDTGKKLRDRFLDYGRILGVSWWVSEQDLEGALQKQGIPTRQEFQGLMDQVDALIEKLNQLQDQIE